MADRYIVHGATFNGDGTSPAAASSNGGVGAWNNINIFQGTAPAYGTLAAGDRVFVRTKDAAGADITVSTATAMTLGSTAATETGPITWVFDPGVVWAGVSGVVTYNVTAAVTLTARSFNNLIARQYNLVLTNTLVAANNLVALSLGDALYEDIKFDLSACIGSNGAMMFVNGGTYTRPWILLGNYVTKGITGNANALMPTMYSPIIELVGSSELDPVFSAPAFCQRDFLIYGGIVTGAAAANGRPLFRVESGAGFQSFGLYYPREMPLSAQSVMANRAQAVANGADGDFGSEFWNYYYAFTSRSDNYPPTLNAFLELSSSPPWSYRLYPHRTSDSNPAQISLSKTWTQDPAVKTITQELLWPTGMAAPTKDKVYLVVQYVENTTGQQRTLYTRDFSGATLDTSTAAWTATTWGLVNLSKYKLSVTTPTAIKKDTAVLVTLFVAPRSATVNDVLFVDPDPSFT